MTTQEGAEAVHQWCADRNEIARTFRKEQWWIVIRREDGALEPKLLTGWRALEARARAEGRSVEWFKGDPEEIEAIHAHAAACASDGGIPISEFNRRCDRGDFSHVGRKGL